jgi:hypothetical protein
MEDEYDGLSCSRLRRRRCSHWRPAAGAPTWPKARGWPSPPGNAAPLSSRPASEPSSPASDEPTAGSTAIRVRIGDAVLAARLRDVPASRDLVAQLPLTLTLRDLNDIEKIPRLPRGLSMDGVPAGDDPAPRGIGYCAPSGDLVFYYGDVGYFPAIVRLGQFDGSVDAIRHQTGEVAATVELADGG